MEWGRRKLLRNRRLLLPRLLSPSDMDMALSASIFPVVFHLAVAACREDKKNVELSWCFSEPIYQVNQVVKPVGIHPS